MRICLYKIQEVCTPSGYHMKNLYLCSKIAEFYTFCIELQA